MASLPTLHANWLDRAVAMVAPGLAVRRLQARFLYGMLTGTGGYTGARRDRRATSEWKTKPGSANEALIPDLPALRDRSEDLMRNEPLARGAVNTVVTSAVGTGLQPQARVDRKLLARVGLSEADCDAFERDAEREFAYWSKSRECDVTRHQRHTEMQDVSLRSTLVRGDVFVLRRWIEHSDRRYGTALQLIEADRVRNPNNQVDRPLLVAGVEMDENGAPLAYHIQTLKPGESTFVAGEIKRVPAFAPSGDRQVWHLFGRLRPDQTRGEPYLAPVIEPLKQLGRYTEAELMAAVISGMLTVFIKTEQGTADLGGGAVGTAGVPPEKDRSLKLGNGAILGLYPNESVDVVDPKRPNVAFDPFVMSILRQIGVALELPFEVLIKHFTASYSAAQAALLTAWQFFMVRRVWLAANFCQPSYEAVLTEAIARGYLRAPGFLGGDPILRAGYLGCEWTGPPRGHINPVDEATAAEKWVDMGVKTLQTVTAETTGGDWQRNHPQRAKEVQMRRRDGLEPPEPLPRPPAIPALPGGGRPAERPDRPENGT